MTNLTFREHLIATQPMIDPDMVIATSLMGYAQPEYANDPFAATAWYNEARALFHVRRIDAVIAASGLDDIPCKAHVRVQPSESEGGASSITITPIEVNHDQA